MKTARLPRARVVSWRREGSSFLAAVVASRHRKKGANSNAVRLSCELLRLFVREAVQRAAIIAEAEGGSKIEATHLERILPQLLLDF
ncbi:hypothetical protein E3N88_15400 [Mikania micrantha]|uniref:Centromere protein X n=1 Tax=Mikania micrantha TaxID=192012 RepID=A0A5N6NV96_9ASTR|nr:hypothetical protein E3N88_15400 [Mikania micrantha]